MKKSIEKSEYDWEAVCARCGRCCYEKVEFAGHIYYTLIPCQFLDTTSRLCRVYARRDRRRPGCVRLSTENVAKGFPAGRLPLRGCNRKLPGAYSARRWFGRFV